MKEEEEGGGAGGEEEEVSGGLEGSDQLNRSPDLHSSRSPTAQSEEASMAVIRNYLSLESSIFPPINHEGLFLYPSPSRPLSSPPPPPRLDSSSLASGKEVDPPSPPCDSRVYLARDFSGWLSFGLELFRSKVVGITYAIRNYAVSKRAFWSFSSAAGIVTAVFVWFLHARARRRRRRRKSIDYLIILIKERDEVGSIDGVLKVFVKMPIREDGY